MRHNISKLVLALGFSAACFLWGCLGVFVYCESIIAARTEGVPLVEWQFITASIIWFAILLALLIAALWSWRRFLRLSIRDVK